MRRIFAWIHAERHGYFNGLMSGLICVVVAYWLSRPAAPVPAVAQPAPAYASPPDVPSASVDDTPLVGQSWIFELDDGDVLVGFGAAPGYHAFLSNGRYGGDATWQPLGNSMTFEIQTNKYELFGWFVRDGDYRITGCGGYATARDGSATYHISSCQRPAWWQELIAHL